MADRDKRQTESSSEAAPGSQQEEIGEASKRLPKRQREALELRELEQLSYEEIGAIMEVSPSSVAQLISRGRINLYDDLRGTVLASVAPPSPECERALPLIAARDDGQLEASPSDAAWLDTHLSGCDRCRLGDDQMRETAAAYRAWEPIAAGGRSPGRAASSRRGPRRRLALAAALAALLLLTGLTLVFAADDRSPTPASPAADVASGGSGGGVEDGGKAAEAGKGKKRAVEKGKTKARSVTAAGETTPVPATTASGAASQGGSGGGASDPAPPPNGSPGKAAVQPTQQAAAPKG